MPKINIQPSGKSISVTDILNQNDNNVLKTENNGKKDEIPTVKPERNITSIKKSVWEKRNKKWTKIKNNEEFKTADNPNRFYLPVLYINDPTQWESKPLSERIHFTDEVAMNTCLGNCCGYENLKASCCHMDMDDLEHVLGPVDEEDIKKIVKFLKKSGINATREDVVIDYEEGKIIGRTFFHNHPVFQSPESYPILRFQVTGPRFVCKFLNTSSGKCTIYQQRPKMCQNYYCNFIKANFLLKTPNEPNTYKKLR